MPRRSGRSGKGEGVPMTMWVRVRGRGREGSDVLVGSLWGEPGSTLKCWLFLFGLCAINLVVLYQPRRCVKNKKDHVSRITRKGCSGQACVNNMERVTSYGNFEQMLCSIYSSKVITILMNALPFYRHVHRVSMLDNSLPGSACNHFPP